MLVLINLVILIIILYFLLQIKQNNSNVTLVPTLKQASTTHDTKVKTQQASAGTFSSGEAIFINNFIELRSNPQYSNIHLLNNVKIAYGSYTRDIDHLIVSQNGIALVENKFWRGTTMILHSDTMFGKTFYNKKPIDNGIFNNCVSDLFTITYQKASTESEQNFFVSYPFHKQLQTYNIFTKALAKQNFSFNNVSTALFFVHNNSKLVVAKNEPKFTEIRCNTALQVNSKVKTTVYFDNELALLLDRLNSRAVVMSDDEVSVIVNYLSQFTNKPVL